MYVVEALLDLTAEQIETKTTSVLKVVQLKVVQAHLSTSEVKPIFLSSSSNTRYYRNK